MQVTMGYRGDDFESSRIGWIERGAQSVDVAGSCQVPVQGKPNLFGFATSELSQDAFIAWLLAWADPCHAHRDVALHGTAVRVLERLLELCAVPRPDQITSVMVQRQYKNIDVVVVVNGRLAIGIEDKVHTKEHSDQLQRYRTLLSDAFSAENVAAVYLKTGDQGSYSDVNKAGYVRFGRTDFLDALRFGHQIGLRNDIVAEFIEHLEAVEAAVNSFRSAPLDEWSRDRNRWIGFFVELQRHLRDTDWKYVPNKSGGFMGFWWYRSGNKYLQLEEEKLCFKIEVEQEDQRSSLWEAWHGKLMNANGSVGLPVRRPHYKSGRWMTVAVLAEDYRRRTASGVLDLEGTLALLRQAERLLDETLRQ